MKHQILTWKKGHYLISTDKKLLQVERIHEFLSKRAYWSMGIPLETVQKSLEASLCFGLYDATGPMYSLVGLARIVTDYATFAWLADVYIEEEYRGDGLSKWLIECVMAYPELQKLRRICLATKDAQTLYEKFGFEISKGLGTYMEIKQENPYSET